MDFVLCREGQCFYLRRASGLGDGGAVTVDSDNTGDEPAARRNDPELNDDAHTSKMTPTRGDTSAQAVAAPAGAVEGHRRLSARVAAAASSMPPPAVALPAAAPPAAGVRAAGVKKPARKAQKNVTMLMVAGRGRSAGRQVHCTGSANDWTPEEDEELRNAIAANTGEPDERSLSGISWAGVKRDVRSGLWQLLLRHPADKAFNKRYDLIKA